MSNQNPYGGGNGYGPPPGGHQQYQQPQQQGYYPPPQAPVVYVQQNTAMVRQGFNHTPHVIISFLTCGTWLPFYLLIWALSGR
jgi:hypothetical protein